MRRYISDGSAVTDKRTPEQRRDDDFEGIMRGLTEALANVKGEPEGTGVRIHRPASRIQPEN
ncbi:hypothetical protein D3C85_1509890 [compost metagenome]